MIPAIIAAASTKPSQEIAEVSPQILWLVAIIIIATIVVGIYVWDVCKIERMKADVWLGAAVAMIATVIIIHTISNDPTRLAVCVAEFVLMFLGAISALVFIAVCLNERPKRKRRG